MRRLAAHRARKDDPLANLGYCCNRYARSGKEHCSYHWLEARDLYDAVLADIRLHARQAMKDGDAFAKQIMERKIIQTKGRFHREEPGTEEIQIQAIGVGRVVPKAL